jgi:hypothetical protein
MPKDTDEIEDLHSSEQVEDIDAGDAAPADVAEAGSSPAADVTPKDTLSIVRDVVRGDAAEATEEPGSSPDGEEEAAPVAAEKPADDENFTDVPFHKHPRFQKLLSDKKAAEVDAVRYRNVQNFLDRAGLQAAEAADGLEIMALAKVDPVKAWERLKPFAEQVAIAAGVILPPDIQQRVVAGEIARDAAADLSKARAQVQAMQAAQRFRQEQAQVQAAQAAQQALVGAATSWEADRQVKDPNFAAKVPELQREIAYLQATVGKPDTPEGVRVQLEQAYKAVNAKFRAAQPAAAPAVRKQPIRAVTGGQVAGNPAPKPRNTLDIINVTLGR